jgi:hypothetical protein
MSVNIALLIHIRELRYLNKQQTVTILYYENEILMELKSIVLQHCQVGEGGRIIISNDLKEGKLIVAVLLGDVILLNKLGDRAFNFTKAD